MSRDILLLGGSGQVGLELQGWAWPQKVSLYAPPRGAIDLTVESEICAVLSQRDWSAVINAAAFTAVDRAESEVSESWRVNALAPAIIASLTGVRRLPLVHISTDYVFDGALGWPYNELDAVRPINVYGASKEGGEQAVRTANTRHLIFRTAWLFSAHRSNFVKSILRLAAERKKLEVIDDHHGCPTSAKDLAALVASAVLRLVEDPSCPTGTYHAVNTGETSWYGFACEIIAQAKKKGFHAIPVEAISAAVLSGKAKRPVNSRLSTNKLELDFGFVFQPWQEALSVILDEILEPINPVE